MAKAYEYHARAAASAQRVNAVEPALEHYTAALAAGAELGLEPDREPALRRLFLQRGRMRFRTGDVGGTGADFAAALDGARRCGDRLIEMETLNELGVLQLRSYLSAAAGCHEAALEIARELDDPAAQTYALDRLAVISAHLLQFDRGLELGERALELARGTGEATVVGRAMDSIKLAVWQLGDLPRLESVDYQSSNPFGGSEAICGTSSGRCSSPRSYPSALARWDEADDGSRARSRSTAASVIRSPRS